MEFERIALVILAIIGAALLMKMAYHPSEGIFSGGKEEFRSYLLEKAKECGECEIEVVLDERIEPSDVADIAILRRPIGPGKYRIVIRKGEKIEIVVA